MSFFTRGKILLLLTTILMVGGLFFSTEFAHALTPGQTYTDSNGQTYVVGKIQADGSYGLQRSDGAFGLAKVNQDGTVTISGYGSIFTSAASGLANVTDWTLSNWNPAVWGPNLILGGANMAFGTNLNMANIGRDVLTTGTEDGTCWDGKAIPNIKNCLAQILYLLLWVISFIVSIVGGVFDFIFLKTVKEIGLTLSTVSVIESGWTVVRDLCNIFFIFILLWLAISTILGLNEHGVKHGLSRLIVAAILINFSLLFTRMVIDVPNMIAVTIYDQVTGGGVQNSTMQNGAGLGSAVFKIISPESVGSKLVGGVSGELNTTSSGGIDDPQAKAFASGTPLTTFFMMIILYATVLFVFLAVCIIFIKRFIILIFLMIFSPLAFLGMAIPIHSLQHEAQHKFWNTLFKESFYAPIFLLCFYVTLATGSAMYQAASSLSGIEGTSATIFAFTVMIVMIIASLIIAEEMGVSGAGGAMTAFKGMSQGATGFVQSRTIGRVASTLINKADTGDKLRDMAAGKYGKNWVSRGLYTAAGRGIVGTADKLGASFDEKVEKDQKWMEDAISNRHGDHQFTAELFAQNMIGSGMYSADRKMLDNQFHHMSLEQKANMYEYLKDMAKRKVGDDILDAHGHKTGKKVTQKDINGAEAAKKRYFEENGHGRLESDEVAELPRITAQGLTYHDQQFKQAAEHAQSTGDTTQMNEFLKGATEGQMLSGVKSVGASGVKFNKAMQDALSNNLMRFQGESMIAAITKDNVLSPEIKSAASASMFKRKVIWDTFTALKGNEAKANAQDVADILLKFKDNLSEIQTEIDAYRNNKNPTTMEALTKAFESKYSTLQASANYVTNGNGRRTLIKSEDAVKEINEVYAAIDKAGSVFSGNIKERV